MKPVSSGRGFCHMGTLCFGSPRSVCLWLCSRHNCTVCSKPWGHPLVYIRMYVCVRFSTRWKWPRADGTATHDTRLCEFTGKPNLVTLCDETSVMLPTNKIWNVVPREKGASLSQLLFLFFYPVGREAEFHQEQTRLHLCLWGQHQPTAANHRDDASYFG